MWKVAVRPRWIGALLLALAVAAAFAALSQWQLERSVASGDIVDRTTETVVPLDTVAQPQRGTSEASAGQLVEATGSFVPDEFVVVADRVNDGVTGFWVVGHFVTDGAGVPVALGWAPTEREASQAIGLLDVRRFTPATVTGRYLPSDGPQSAEFEDGKLHSVSTPALVNVWMTVDESGVYGGYILATDAAAGLEQIPSPAPSVDVQVNWLNIFYAAEWVIFAGFAVFLWYRLVKDAWEREEHERADANRN